MLKYKQIHNKEKNMELYKEILINALEKQKAEVYFPDLKLSAKEIVELNCYKTLKQIKDVLEDKNLEDADCFERIEQIVCIFEKNCGGVFYRHDF